MSENKKCIKHNIYFNEKFGCEHCRIEALEQNSLPKAIYEGLIRANVNGFNKHVDEISELKEKIEKEWSKIDYAHRVSNGLDEFLACSRIKKLESVLKDHLESHENVARGQLNPDISQTALFQLFDRDIKKQLQKLSGEKDSKPDSEFDNEMIQICKVCGGTTIHKVSYRKDLVCISRENIKKLIIFAWRGLDVYSDPVKEYNENKRFIMKIQKEVEKK